ncbi:secretory lipase [Fusarium subglutinans]|uniref:Secretory lipase n=1 Tax=Gibberella subglutinans TaxID=42677 RepID=A0A8H5QE73_GIBSU|nr:secretory lipase [Fusarium subglutinans]KAF5612862.1 secretory lipase [Fusarium subglutinans]
MSEHQMAIPKGSWVLVTAANGHTGSHIVFELLKRDFKVRGTVRDLESSQWLLEDSFVYKYAERGHIELIVADTTKPHDFDRAVRGVAAVIHVAVIGDLVPDPNVAIPATIESALSVCRSAAKEPSVKRFVFTSTFWAATFPVPGVGDTITNLDTWNEAAIQAAWAPPPYESDRIMPVYFAAKVEAEKAVWKFVKDKRLPCITSHVTDVAIIHVAAAIDPGVQGQRIQVLAPSFTWNDCLDILRKSYPNRSFVDNFISGDPKLMYNIENDIALGLLQKWAGRGWISLESSVTEVFQPGTLQFINSAHPDEITNAKSIKLIRSHAAKLSRALQKEKKQDKDSLEGDDPENFQAETELRSLVDLASNTRYRKIIPKAKVHEQTANRPPSPIQLIGGACSDAYTGFARQLSDDEHYLFDFYLNYVISYGYTACYAQDDERNFTYLMRHIWVPNAMSKLSLMAAVFHVACRNYVATTNNSLSSKFAVKKLQYRLMCIQMAKDAIESEAIATDTTIALAMLMASEAFLEGDMSAYWSHGAGVMKMVRARGGVDMLGMSGFLTRTVSDSIYLTQTNMISGFAASQDLQAAIHTTSWNSTFKLSHEQLSLGNLTIDEGAQINNIINFDRTLLANGGPHQDDFYSLPPGLQIPRLPGELIKLQEITDPKPYTILASTTMSRFLYSTTNFNGTLIPASAYILWPYTTKKSLLQDFVPYALVLAGYAVVAPDYAGLGVGTSWDGTAIPHQYGIYQAGGADSLNALRAALTAFPERLTTDYVNVGHSQGGAVGWGVSELLAGKKGRFKDLVKGHLGTLLFAPPTDAFSLPAASITTWVGKYLNQVYPEFKLSDWLTTLGVDRVTLFNQVEGSQSVSSFLFTPKEEVVQPDWMNTWFVAALKQIVNPGERPWKGPMLVIHGDKDPAVHYNASLATSKVTCEKYPGDLEFLGVPGVGHFPGMYATRSIWMDWIKDRFERRKVQKQGCVQSKVDRFLPDDHYQHDPNSFPLWAGKSEWAYELPQGH